MVVTVPSFWTACHGLGRARQWRRWCLSARLCSAVLWKFIDDGMRRQTAASTATTCKIKGERPWVYLPQAQNKKSDLSPAPNRVTMLSPAGKILQFYSLLLSHCSYPKLVLLHGSFWAALLWESALQRKECQKCLLHFRKGPMAREQSEASGQATGLRKQRFRCLTSTACTTRDGFTLKNHYR